MLLVYMDYIDFIVGRQRKAIKLNHSLTNLDNVRSWDQVLLYLPMCQKCVSRTHSFIVSGSPHPNLTIIGTKEV